MYLNSSWTGCRKIQGSFLITIMMRITLLLGDLLQLSAKAEEEPNERFWGKVRKTALAQFRQWAEHSAQPTVRQGNLSGALWGRGLTGPFSAGWRKGGCFLPPWLMEKEDWEAFPEQKRGDHLFSYASRFLHPKAAAKAVPKRKQHLPFWKRMDAASSGVVIKSPALSWSQAMGFKASKRQVKP